MGGRKSGPAEHAQVVLALSQHVVRFQGVLDQRLAPVLAAASLTRAEFDVIAALRSTGTPYELRPKELSARLLLTTGGLSTVLRRLEMRGLISRTPDPADGRGQLIRLTADGVVAAEETASEAITALQRVLAPIGKDQLVGALQSLHAILDVIDHAPPLMPGLPRTPAR